MWAWGEGQKDGLSAVVEGGAGRRERETGTGRQRPTTAHAVPEGVGNLENTQGPVSCSSEFTLIDEGTCGPKDEISSHRAHRRSQKTEEAGLWDGGEGETDWGRKHD